MAVVTITGSDVSGGSPSGGGVGGASNLTTAGAVPYVASAGVLTQAPTGLFYDSANVRLGVGTGTPNFTLTVSSAGASGQAQITGTSASAYGGFNLANNIGYVLQIGTYGTANANANEAFMYAAAGVSALRIWTADSTTPIKFIPGNTERARFAPTTGNFLLGTTTDDGSNKLQVAGNMAITASSDNLKLIGASGQTPGIVITQTGVGNFSLKQRASTGALDFIDYAGYRLGSWSQSGNLTVFSEFPTTGSTSLVVRAGAGQSSNNLQEWRNNAGTALAELRSSGSFVNSGATAALTASVMSTGGTLQLGNTAGLTWGSGGFFDSAKDSGISRASAGVVEINNGTAGTLRDLLLRYLQNTGVTVATLPAAAAGNAGSRAYVTDANATTIGTTVAGGGANKVMVWSDGTNWKIYAS